MKSKKVHKNPSSKGRVFVGMSGGVDSSVSALLLVRAGYDVTGVFIKTWSPEWMVCDWRAERRDAIRVAAHIGIPLLTLDLEAEYKQEVAEYMIAEYREGRTPNPDVMCNKYIKFGGFYTWAREQGANYIATGHYARTEDGKLLTGVDVNKDQSYFLWTVSANILRHTLFPIGELEKSEVREIARKAKLPVAEKKDSQGICFLGTVDMKEFLKHYIETKPGDVLNENGEKVGTHEGAVLYTLGEHYIGYIIARDLERNTITVSDKKPEELLAKKEFELKETNWVSGEPETSRQYLARVRYRQELQMVKLEVAGERQVAVFDKPQNADAGQSIVVYDGDVCLGGGIIV